MRIGFVGPVICYSYFTISCVKLIVRYNPVAESEKLLECVEAPGNSRDPKRIAFVAECPVLIRGRCKEMPLGDVYFGRNDGHCAAESWRLTISHLSLNALWVGYGHTDGGTRQ